MNKFLFFSLFLLSQFAFAQNKTSAPASTTPPKLIVGIVVDQMRWDYLYRFADKYGQTGFKRLQTGYSCENTHIPYVPTYTAPGHTCIYTGSVPSLHGIIGNDWYSRNDHRQVYCTEDAKCKPLGTKEATGQMSPDRMLTTTITDELRLASNFKSKVIGVAIKDRGAILPAGHTANRAYWMESKTGHWISSSYYGDTLPAWVDAFNDKKLPAKYISENWKTILDLNLYGESTKDDESWERPFKKEDKPIFPHTFKESEKSIDLLKSTPWGNTLTFDFAKTALTSEHLGHGSGTDFLTVSCSSTDYIGHQFGPNSVEIEDCYIRFDRDLGDFLSYLDKEVGVGNYTVFLTADHGAAHADGFNKENRILSGVYSGEDLVKQYNQTLKAKFGRDSLIEWYSNMQLYLNYDTIAKYNLNQTAVKNELIQLLLQIQGVSKVLDLGALSAEALPAQMKEMFINGYNQKRSGDIQVVYEPAHLEGMTKGTTHGSAYNYDSHIPLLWYGSGIKSGRDYSQIYMTDISATLAALLHIQEPSGCIGKPIDGLIKK